MKTCPSIYIGPKAGSFRKMYKMYKSDKLYRSLVREIVNQVWAPIAYPIFCRVYKVARDKTVIR